MDKKNIVILGAGFGGIAAARRIAEGISDLKLSEKYQTILIDRNDYRTYTPFIYRYAASADESVSKKESVWPLVAFLENLPITLIYGEIASIDLMNGDIHLKAGEEIKTDFAVIALGSESNDFGIPGASANSLPFKTFADAEAIRVKLGELIKDNPHPKVVVGGAGANGIEIASQIKYLHPQCDVTIVEAMATVIPGLDPKVAEALSNRLAELGVAVRLNAKMTNVSENAITLEGGDTIPFDLMIWTAGVKATALATQLPLNAQRGKPVADAGMTCLPQTADLKLAPMVYAVGDTVCFVDPATQRPMPSVAHVAIEQGKIAAENVLAEIAAKENISPAPMAKPYIPGKLPYAVYVISAGGSWAAAKIGPVVISGWLGWMFKRLVTFEYLVTTLPLAKAVEFWTV